MIIMTFLQSNSKKKEFKLSNTSTTYSSIRIWSKRGQVTLKPTIGCESKPDGKHPNYFKAIFLKSSERY